MNILNNIKFDCEFIEHGSTFEVLPAITLYNISENAVIIDFSLFIFTLTVTVKYVRR